MARIIAALMLLALLPSSTHAQKRLALLIGNQGYAPAIGALASCDRRAPEPRDRAL